MDKVNTRTRIKQAALPLFLEKGYAQTSIAAIEKAAELAPRAGTFYRHFSSKEALFEELAREQITETPDEFDFDGLSVFGDTRAELIAIARQFEIASKRQEPYLRLIEELRLTSAGQAFEAEANAAMLAALAQWVGSKPAAAGLEHTHLSALALNVFGAWLFYLTKAQQGVDLDSLPREQVRKAWADHWSEHLDRPR